MTAPHPFGAMSSSRVILGELLSSRARLRFPGRPQAQPITPRSPTQNTANRNQGLLTLSHSRGSLQLVKPPNPAKSP